MDFEHCVRSKARGVPPKKLTPAQERQVFRWVNAKRPDQCGLTGELFVELLKKIMHRRKKPVRLVVEGLPAHKKAIVKEYASTAGKLTLHFLPGYAPDLNPDELMWSYAKRTGMARSPMKAGEKLQCRVDEQLQNIANDSALVKTFFRHPSVANFSDL